ncbi:MAG: alpha/beta hydrolase family protein, partial [bacterium]
VIGDYKGPVHLEHGDKDDVVDISYSERASQIYENVEYEVIHGAGHGFQGKHLRQSNELVLAFLDKTVTK